MKLTLTIDDITAAQIVTVADALGMDNPQIVVATPPATPPAEEPATPPATPPAEEPATVPAGPEGGVDQLDSAGLPWDHRIHSREKSRIKKDNTWRKKRGVDPELVAQVEAELRQAQAIPTAEAPATAPAEPAAPAANMNFVEFMQTITAAGIDSDATTAACSKYGIASTALLATRPDLIPIIYDELFPSA